jgi:hypothetical protein
VSIAPHVSNLDSVIFVHDENHYDAKIAGGVQVCTREYVRLLNACAYQVKRISIAQDKSLLARLRIRLGIDFYGRYDFSAACRLVSDAIEKSSSRAVVLNQVALAPLAALLRTEFGDKIVIAVASHGNESGDYLHEVVRREEKRASIYETFRVGKLIRTESEIFSNDVDVVLAMSETELQIANWLGAKQVIYIPRLFEPDFLSNDLSSRRIGFIGSLHHKPNYDGLVSLLVALSSDAEKQWSLRVIGGPAEIGSTLQRQYPGVEYVGAVDDDALRQEASTWAMFVNPVFWFARGASTKLATAINWGIPIISTPPGNRGYVWNDGEVLTVRTPEQMAGAVTRLLNDQGELRAVMSRVQSAARSGPKIEDLAQLVKHAFGA